MTTVDPTSPLDELIRTSDGSVVIPDTWQQGRGAFGGLIAAILIRALEESSPGRALRSVTLELCGPINPGRANLALEPLRVGNAVTTTAARLSQDDGVLAYAVGVLGSPRAPDQDRGPGARLFELTPPSSMPDWRTLAPVSMDVPGVAVFTRHFEFRNTGPLPFTSQGPAHAEGFIRLRSPGKRRDAAFLAACIDAYWPAVFPLWEVPRPMATIAFMFQPFVYDDGIDPEAPLFYRAHTLALAEGYCAEHRELWSEDGRLLALNDQTLAIIK